jgi:hypothetical protein
MPRAVFEAATPATKRPQTYALDRAATEVGCWYNNPIIIVNAILSREWYFSVDLFILASKFKNRCLFFTIMISHGTPSDISRNSIGFRGTPVEKPYSKVKVSRYAIQETREKIQLLLILDLGIRWRWMVSVTPLPRFTPRKDLRYPLDRRLGGPQSWSGHTLEEFSFASPGNEPQSSRRLVCSQTLYWLSYSSSAYARLHTQNRRYANCSIKHKIQYLMRMKFCCKY